MYHYENQVLISETADKVFDFVDDHMRFSSHMSKSSIMMGGGKMQVMLDDKHGQEIGSHIILSGNIFGVNLYLDEVVTERERPYLKVWKTVGIPKLLVIGNYQIKIEIKPQDNKSLLRVSIDYEMPDKNVWLGKLFGGIYAKWCVGQMIEGVKQV